MALAREEGMQFVCGRVVIHGRMVGLGCTKAAVGRFEGRACLDNTGVDLRILATGHG